jgi:hypothetical protein
VSDNPYDGIMRPTRLDKAVDRVIAEENARPITPNMEAAAAEHAIRWKSLEAAERMAGPHGVVLPMATAHAILAALEGRESDLSRWSGTLPARMLAQAIDRAEPPRP